MNRTFKTSVRLFLGIPTTKEVCNVGKCKNVPIHPNGQHAYHAKACVTTRHHKVKDTIGHVFQRLYTSGHCKYRCHFETALSTIDIQQKEDGPNKADAVADFYLENAETGHIIITDGMVTHQSFDKVDNHSTPLFAVAEGVKAKYKRYMENYPIRKEDIIPLVF